ncbi:MAG: lipopolysaccharide biosynthesis protein [Acidobacteria bacterium]|nr:MAG: lipopolysaccharide biosynthesis protein [Acidobacteriota bacterium]
MIENRELTIDDYLAILRRRLKVILIPTLLAPLVGFAVSFAFAPKYTSQSLVLVEEQKVPEGYVKPVVTQDLGQRVTTLEQRALSAENLRPLIESLGLAHGNDVDAEVDAIRDNVSIQPVLTTALGPTPTGRNKSQSQVPGFNVSFVAHNPRKAQSLCAGVTNIMMRENFTDNIQASQLTTDFLARQVEDAKRNLNDLDSRLANFKKQYLGQLPGDEDNNLKILMGMNSQLDANTQTLNRAQQDKAYTESLLAQQLSAWKSSQTSTSPQSLQQQLTTLQSQLITLQAHYTDDYPDVLKTKRDVAEIQKKLDEINAAAANPTSAANDKENLAEPPEIRQLRLQIHQYEQVISQATRDQQKLQEQIKIFQSRVALSPSVEEEYKQLTRDYDTAQKFYDDQLAKKKESETQAAMVREQQGEQMRVLNAADLPESPSFPNRLLFAGGGLAGGLALGLGLALWLELRDTALRTENDVQAAIGLPVLGQVPWVGLETAEKNGNRKTKSGLRKREEEKETVEV